jgi:hypothetical protein
MVMSACGPKQTWAGALQMSAFSFKADISYTTVNLGATPVLPCCDLTVIPSR